jgi:hypothetical protein
MEKIFSSELSVDFDWTSWRHIPKDGILHYENAPKHIYLLVFFFVHPVPEILNFLINNFMPPARLCNVTLRLRAT